MVRRWTALEPRSKRPSAEHTADGTKILLTSLPSSPFSRESLSSGIVGFSGACHCLTPCGKVAVRRAAFKVVGYMYPACLSQLATSPTQSHKGWGGRAAGLPAPNTRDYRWCGASQAFSSFQNKHTNYYQKLYSAYWVNPRLLSLLLKFIFLHSLSFFYPHSSFPLLTY